MIFPPARVTVLAAALTAHLGAQTTLKILQPAGGTVVHPGESIVIYVEASGEPLKGVAIAAGDPIRGAQPIARPPYQFEVLVPLTTQPGVYKLTAFGNTTSGQHVASAGTNVNVERADAPVRIAVNRSQLEMAVGGTSVILIQGVYADGSKAELSRSGQTLYETSPEGVISVRADGVVKALAPGSANIAIRHRGHQAIVKVTITATPE